MSSETVTAPEVGAEIPALQRQPTEVQLFAFSAATWNAHRIHYDPGYARDVEGYPNILVQSHLHACFLSQAITGAFGPRARLVRLGWQNRGIAVPADTLTITGKVSGVEQRGEELRVELALEERNQRDELCVKGWAAVVLPKDES
jgi:hydroxyacyl-ACP dehydratase HTD2-like protein with hotdog domain